MVVIDFQNDIIKNYQKIIGNIVAENRAGLNYAQKNNDFVVIHSQ